MSCWKLGIAGPLCIAAISCQIGLELGIVGCGVNGIWYGEEGVIDPV
jgi:hypothetical protein